MEKKLFLVSEALELLKKEYGLAINLRVFQLWCKKNKITQIGKGKFYFLTVPNLAAAKRYFESKRRKK